MARHRNFDARLVPAAHSAQFTTDEEATCTIGRSIDLGGGRHVEIGRLRGSGAAGAVHRGHLLSPHGVRRSVAVKLFAPLSCEDDPLLDDLAVITRRLAAVDHPNVVRVYECGSWDLQPFLLTELVDGVSLRTLEETFAAKHRRVPLDVALFVACEVAEGLAAARSARDHQGLPLGIVHQNLNANEVLLSWRGEVKVSDFELSAVPGAVSGVRDLRSIVKRVAAMAPEVAQGRGSDGRSDVFSLGILLRELFVGARFPVDVTHPEAVRLARQGYIQPLTFQPNLPAALVNVIARAVEPKPEARYPNASAMLQDLRRIALAMGVGDAKSFLRSTLRHEWPDDLEVGTVEWSPAPMDDMDDRYGPTVVPLKRRK